MSGFEMLMWAGVAVALAGVVGLLATAAQAWKLRQSGLSEDAMRAALQKGVARNLAALMVAVLGLMMVIMGIALR